jgi:sirohydrochlorin cobaltochelatase
VGNALPDAWVGLAYLELQAPTLAESLEDAVRAGATDIRVVPVFWATGGHMINDLPPLLETFRSNHPGFRLELLPVLSELPGMLDFIAGIIASQGRFR